MARKCHADEENNKKKADIIDDSAADGEPTADDPGFPIFSQKGPNNPHTKIIGHIDAAEICKEIAQRR